MADPHDIVEVDVDVDALVDCADPYALFAAWRAAGPLLRTPSGFVVATSWQAAMDALRECPGGGQEAIRNALRTADPSFAAVLAGLSGGSYAGPAGSNFYPGGPGGIASSVATPRLVSPH